MNSTAMVTLNQNGGRQTVPMTIDAGADMLMTELVLMLTLMQMTVVMLMTVAWIVDRTG